MKKLNFKKIGIAIVLAVVLIIEFFALGLSKAKKVGNINLSVKDVDDLINAYTIVTDIFDGGESGYYIELPEFINSKKVVEFNVKEKKIISSDEDNNENLENIESEEQNEQETEIQEEQKELEVIQEVSKQPGDKLYLTEDELNNNIIELDVKYDKKVENELVLYNTKLEKTVDSIDNSNEENQRTITVQGYVPNYASLSSEDVLEEQKNKFDEQEFEGFKLKGLYNIKINSNGEKPYDDSNEFEISISNINIEKDYMILMLMDENEIKQDEKNIELLKSEKIDKKLKFVTDKINTFAIFESVENEEKLEKIVEDISIQEDDLIITRAAAPLRAASSDNEDVWDGSIATAYTLGEGTEEFPYLISKASELAYLASQVNSGTTYEGVYFELTNDINLDQRNWTPIGTISNSFRGIFDGAGHTISNANITIASIPTTLTTYGIFGSIGGGYTRSIIKNTEFNSINISVTATGTTSNTTTNKGYHLGIVSGTMYRNSSIINVIAKNCLISNTQRIELYNYYFRIAIGGICGIALNTSSSETDPGSSLRYSIENCYSDVDIDFMARDRQDDRTYFGQYAAGGIIGIIRSQPVWPSNCLYNGTIISRGFTGPIFGQLRNSTSYTYTSNYATLWNGNDAGNLTMNSYYNNYSTGETSTSFTDTVYSGTSTYRVSSNSSSMGYVQGVNKGIYTNNISTRLSGFNNYASDEYSRWEYSNGTFSLIPNLSLRLDDTNKPTYIVNILNQNENHSYTYKWYINDVLDSTIQGNSITKEQELDIDYNIKVIVNDGSYYSILQFTIPKIKIEVEFSVNEATAKVSATLTCNAFQVDLNDYTYQWYILDTSGLLSEIIDGETGLTLNNLEKGVEYKLVATNKNTGALVEGSFIFGTRTVIYVDYNDGDNTNNGHAPETPVKTIDTAYTKLPTNGNTKTNVIVIMGNYKNSSYLNSKTSNTYKKNTTITRSIWWN